MRRLPLPAPETAAILLFLFLFPPPLEAVTCHCFKDRTFDASRPAAIDPYLLATTQNSFFSAAFGLPKQAVVKAKMSGVSGDDLWVSYYASRKSGRRAGDLMAARRSAPSWRRVLEDSGLASGRLGERFAAAVKSGGKAEDLAAVAAAETLATLLGTARADLDRMLAAGGSSAEIVAAAFLGIWKAAPDTPQLLEDVKAGRTTWGSLLFRVGIEPSEIEGRVRSLIGGAGRSPGAPDSPGP